MRIVAVLSNNCSFDQLMEHQLFVPLLVTVNISNCNDGVMLNMQPRKKFFELDMSQLEQQDAVQEDDAAAGITITDEFIIA